MKILNEVIDRASKVYQNLTAAELVELAIVRREGVLTSSGALRVTNGQYTGRSPNDKFIVDSPAIHNDIDWNNNTPFDSRKFIHLYNRMMAYSQNRELFIFDGFAGTGEHRVGVRFINEFAWQNLFVQQLFIRPSDGEKAVHNEFKVICMPGFKAVPEIDGTNSKAFIVINFEYRLVLIGGTHYAGEIKKSIFTVMNYLLPKQGILSMHCAANVGAKGDVALFFWT